MPRKTLFVISDTHIGAGGQTEGNKLEDFISDAEFVAWLGSLVAESQRDGIEMELIINGDWIEFLQIPAVAAFVPHQPYPPAAYNDVAEAAALQRLDIVLGWRPGMFLSLRDFLHPGFPRRSLTILFGNHDPELAYAGVQARIRAALGDEAGLVTVGARSYWRDGVFIEHGNAYTEQVDRFTNPDRPFDPADPAKVEHPVGSKFVTNFFNGLEWERPWVDGIYPVTTLIFFAIAFEPAYALRVLRGLLAAAPDILVGMTGAPGPGEGPITSALRAQIEDPVQAEALLRRLESDPAFAADFARQVQQAFVEQGIEPALPPELAAAAEMSPIARARAIEEQYWVMLEQAAEQRAQETGARVVLFGHIHERIEKTLPSGALYLNTGTWIWKGDFSQATDELWQDLIHNPDKYANTRDLTYARIDFDDMGAITRARLERAAPAPILPPPPGPQPRPAWFTRLLLAIRRFLQRLFTKT